MIKQTYLRGQAFQQEGTKRINIPQRRAAYAIILNAKNNAEGSVDLVLNHHRKSTIG